MLTWLALPPPSVLTPRSLHHPRSPATRWGGVCQRAPPQGRLKAWVPARVAGRLDTICARAAAPPPRRRTLAGWARSGRGPHQAPRRLPLRHGGSPADRADGGEAGGGTQTSTLMESAGDHPAITTALRCVRGTPSCALSGGRAPEAPRPGGDPSIAPSLTPPQLPPNRPCGGHPHLSPPPPAGTPPAHPDSAFLRMPPLWRGKRPLLPDPFLYPWKGAFDSRSHLLPPLGTGL